MMRGGKHPLLLLGVLLLALSTIPAYAEGPGAIEGQLVNGTPGGESPKGLQLTLHIYQKGQQIAEKVTTTDDAGRFRFEGLETGQDYLYQVSTSYQGADFFTQDINLSDNPKKGAELKIYEITDSDEAIRVPLQSFILGGTSPQGGLVVLEVFTINNEGNRAFVGKEDASGGPPKMLRFSLPPASQDVFFHQGPPGAQILQVDTGFALKAPLPPGRTDISFAYRIPYSSRTIDFPKSFSYPTESFQIVIPDDSPVQATSSGLPFLEKKEVEGKQYRFYIGHDLKAGTKITIGLSGLPSPGPLSAVGTVVPASLLSPQGAAVLGGALALGAVLTYALVRKRPAPTREKPSTPRRSPTRPSASPKEGRVPRRTKPTKEAPLNVERKRLLSALAELDQDYEEGKVPEEDYRRHRSEVKSHLVEMTRQLREEQGKG